MISLGSDWYRKIWTLDIMNQSWVEGTKEQVDFLIDELELQGDERILDLACGFGRHSIELAQRGFSVMGIDITKDYVDFANKAARENNLDAEFLLADIRELTFKNEFDVVINMGDGAIGYLENEDENLKIFDVIANALKSGGKHFMDIMNADYAKHHFPCKLWDEGEKSLTLSKFEWDERTKVMLYGQLDYMYGEPLTKPVIEKGNPTRLYSLFEIERIMEVRGLVVRKSYSDYSGAEAFADAIQLMVYSQLL
ncbi:MAG: class I SAM-dependent methyltransferase [Lachnospiraceae bacterium]|nr:class I SAM-dependent methyltransferase [Lachnospiraceae bacterium]